MATRKLVLGGATTLLLSGAVIAAAPVLAQSSSDPARAYSAANARYESELQDYRQRQQAYEQQQADYNAKVTAYENALSEPAPTVVLAQETSPDALVVVDDPDPDVVVVDPDSDTAIIVQDAPAGTAIAIEEPDDFASRLIVGDVPPLVRLEDVANVNDAFFNVPVLDAMGLPAGHFRRIETKGPANDLVAVVTLNNPRRTISMLTEHVRLDPDGRVMIADLTARQMDLIPSGFPYG